MYIGMPDSSCGCGAMCVCVCHEGSVELTGATLHCVGEFVMHTNSGDECSTSMRVYRERNHTNNRLYIHREKPHLYTEKNYTYKCLYTCILSMGE
jgi:hypothetical protein